MNIGPEEYDSTVNDKKRTNFTNKNYNENATQYGVSCQNNSLHRLWKLGSEKLTIRYGFI